MLLENNVFSCRGHCDKVVAGLHNPCVFFQKLGFNFLHAGDKLRARHMLKLEMDHCVFVLGLSISDSTLRLASDLESLHVSYILSPNFTFSLE